MEIWSKYEKREQVWSLWKELGVSGNWGLCVFWNGPGVVFLGEK